MHTNYNIFLSLSQSLSLSFSRALSSVYPVGIPRPYLSNETCCMAYLSKETYYVTYQSKEAYYKLYMTYWNQ